MNGYYRRHNHEHILFVKWLKRNKKELREFLDLKFKVKIFNGDILDWSIGVKDSYDETNKRHKKVTDKIFGTMKEIDLGSRKKGKRNVTT